jgi:L-Ala-D/L-Glu epimerase
VEVSARIVRLDLAETFVIAREEQDSADVVQLEVRHDGVVGHGEAAPIERYGESAASALAFVEEHGGLLGDDPFALDEIGARLAEAPGEQAAKSALDSALHDLQGRLSDCRPGVSSACVGLDRRRRGRSGSATRTRWPDGQSARRATGGSVA